MKQQKEFIEYSLHFILARLESYQVNRLVCEKALSRERRKDKRERLLVKMKDYDVKIDGLSSIVDEMLCEYPYLKGIAEEWQNREISLMKYV